MATALILAPTIRLADTIHLRNGTRFEGKVVGQTRTAVRVLTGKRVRSVPKTEIRRIQYGPIRSVSEQAEREKAEREKAQREKTEREKTQREKAEREKTERERATRSEQPRRANQASDTLTRGAVLWRNALLPGWGFRSRGDSFWGILYTGSFLGSLLVSGGLYARATNAKASYNSSVASLPAIAYANFVSSTQKEAAVALFGIQRLTQDGNRFAKYQRESGRFNVALGITGALYLAQLIHGWFTTDAHGATRLHDKSHFLGGPVQLSLEHSDVDSSDQIFRLGLRGRF